MKAVIYGAGNIGRGFIGQLFYESGYEITFIDVNSEIVDKINTDNGYPITIIDNHSKDIRWVYNIKAVNGRDLDAVAKCIAEADLVATSVGANILPFISNPILNGLRLRWAKSNFDPLNIILCENINKASNYFSQLIQSNMTEQEKLQFSDSVGLVDASIGRMVPIMTPDKQEGNILSIWVEPYCDLPLDKDGFKGSIPEIKNMIVYSPFSYYVEKKLFIHNMGHAMTAYLGFLRGYQYIWQAINDPEINYAVRKAMMESSIALSNRYKVDIHQLSNHVDDLLERFANSYLGDTIQRVGKNPSRKLKNTDRLVGAALCCLDEDINPQYIALGIASALFFKDDDDDNFNIAFGKHIHGSIKYVITDLCGLSMDSRLLALIESQYNILI